MKHIIGNCLVQHRLGGSSAIERLVQSIVVVVVPEPSQPAGSAGWTASPERVEAVDPHWNNLKPLGSFDSCASVMRLIPYQLHVTMFLDTARLCI